MPIIRTNHKASVPLTAQPFESEDLLQKIVANNPSLLSFGDDPPIAFVSREFSLPGAGSLDILLFNSEGLPYAFNSGIGICLANAQVMVLDWLTLTYVLAL